MAWNVRQAEPYDREAILALVREAFSGPHHDGQEEVTILLDTWRLGATVPGLELVAAEDEGLIGYVLGARGDLQGRSVPAVAPLAVSTARKGQGVGTALMNELLTRADKQGWPLVVLLGDPNYYSRFGFEAAGTMDIVYKPVGKDDPHFQVRWLEAFDPSVRGEFRYCWELHAG